MNYAFLKDLGIDSEKAIERCMGNEALYLELLRGFPEDTSVSEARALYESGDVDGAYACLHELKGVSGNLGVNQVFDITCAMLHLLREGMPEELPVYFERLSSVYDLAVRAIEEAFQD